MIARVATAVIKGFDAVLVTAECDMTKGLPAFNIVGLADKSIGESRERVRSAITNSGFTFPAKRITINLTPADITKDGSHLDLAIALSILIASGQLRQSDTDSYLFAGELGLNGELHTIRGALNFAECALMNKLTNMIVPCANAGQAALVSSISVAGATTLSSVVAHLLREHYLPITTQSVVENVYPDNVTVDDISGQAVAKRALEIAAAGHHNLLLSGPPGSGKTMLAKALPSLLPPLTATEILETTKLHSLAGESDDIIARRPFRSPHHTASYAALVGGGAHITPGEISLAHNGVLFLDEIPEFNARTLEALRQPLEDHMVHISRSTGKATYPANFMLLATMNPCPCGYYGDPTHECSCSQQQIANYQKRLSGPLLDRIDLFITASRVPKKDLLSGNRHNGSNTPQTTKKWRQAIAAARTRQVKRQGCPNASLTNRQLKELIKFDNKASEFLLNAAEKMKLSARGYFKTMRVAATIADLAEHNLVTIADIAEALQYRQHISTR